MSRWLLVELLATGSVPLATAGAGGLRGAEPNASDFSLTGNTSLPLLETSALAEAAFGYTSYWDGQCTPCPANLYYHCSQGGHLIGERGCGTLNVYCEGRCSVRSQPSHVPAPTPPVPAPAISSNRGCVNYGCGGYVSWHDCQCNSACAQHGNCCADYWDVCQQHSTPRRRRGVAAPASPPPPLIPAPAQVPAPASPPPPLVSTPAPTPVPLPADANSALLQPSNADVKTFYMYRAQGATSYPPSNINTGNLAGVMWYLQHEVVSGAYGSGNKFGISRIIRYTVKTKATQPLLEHGMNFGVRVAFDSGKCTGPQCDFSWHTYGYNVGCNKLGHYPYPDFDTHYPGGIWYSLPGQCPSMTYQTETDECKLQEPGGRCSGLPTGTADCTWSYEDHGEQIMLDELYEFAGKATQAEFWGSPDDESANSEKVRVATTLFANKYGNNFSDPICDFSYSNFYPWR